MSNEKEKLKVNEKVASGKFKEFAERIVNLGFASQKYMDGKIFLSIQIEERSDSR